MAAVPLHYVDLRTFCYATEDEKRIEDALRTYLPEEFEIDRAETEGYHGDRILVFSARVEHADGIRRVLDALRGSADLDLVREQLDDRVTENCELFLYLDKQAAFRGEVALGEGITLRAKIEAYPAKKDSAIENVREIL